MKGVSPQAVILAGFAGYLFGIVIPLAVYALVA